MELIYKQQGNDDKLKLMTTTLERFKALVAYFLTFSFQVLCIISEKMSRAVFQILVFTA